MDGYILYGDHRSGSSTAEMAPVEIGAPFELRPVPLEGDHQLDPEYRRINPMGRVPTLILPDGTVMTESPAILLTLADRHPEARRRRRRRRRPAIPAARGRCAGWCWRRRRVDPGALPAAGRAGPCRGGAAGGDGVAEAFRAGVKGAGEGIPQTPSFF